MPLKVEEFKLLSAEEMVNLVNLAKQGDQLAKEKLINGNYPLIKSVVKHYLNKGIDYDDLYQIGVLGFLKAIANFDPKYEVKFSTYAMPMINGEIKRYMRDDGIIKVSRALKTLAIKVKKFLDEWQKTHDDMPHIKQIAQALQAGESDIVLALDSCQALVSLDSKLDQADSSSAAVGDILVIDDDTDKMLENIALRQAITKLPSRERKILLLRYFRGKTQSEVAQIMQVSQVQISRIESKIISQLKLLIK